LAWLYVDGTFASPTVAAASSLTASYTGGSSGTQITCSANRVVTGLSQGSHTLSLEYKSVFGQSISFEEVTNTAIPYRVSVPLGAMGL